VEEIGEYPDAALLELGGPRILRVIDEVPMEVLGNQPLLAYLQLQDQLDTATDLAAHGLIYRYERELADDD
jgi:hypothetical protein